MSIAGVVSYKVKPDGSLDGRWTHPELGGRIAAERASGGTPGQPAGRYAVEIRTPDGEKLYEGELVIRPLGEAYALAWSGHLLPAGQPAAFSGIGMIEGTDTLVATFQRDDNPPAVA